MLTTLSLVVAAIVLAGNAAATTRVYPHCGTLAKCMSNANPGDTVVLKTNGTAVVPNFGLTKGLSLKPAAGYKPTVASNGSVSTIAISPAENGATVSIRGIRFRNVELNLEFDDGSDHRVIVVGNRFTNPGDDGIISYYGGTSSGTLTIRNNRIAFGGTGIDARVQGGTVTIGGNQVYGTGRTPSTAGSSSTSPSPRSSRVGSITTSCTMRTRGSASRCSARRSSTSCS